MSFVLRPLYEWAEDSFMSDEVSVFLDFCRREYYKEPTDEVSQQVFLGLKENFEKSR